MTKIYLKTQGFPKEEVYGLTNQIRRASVSIPSNIAEGAGRETNKEYIRFLYISRGSLMELDTQILIAKNLKYINKEEYKDIINDIESIGKMLNGLINYRLKLNKNS